MVEVPAKVQSRTFKTSTEFQEWTEDVIRWSHDTIREVEEVEETNLKQMVLEIEGAKAILRGALSALPTTGEGMVNNFIGSKKAASAIAAKLSRAADDLMTASRQHRRASDAVRESAGKVRAAFALFERDYLGFSPFTASAQQGMKIDHKRPRARSSQNGSPRSVQTTSATP